MAVSYSGSHPDLPGAGITPTPGLESAKPSFEATAAAAPSLSPYEAAQAQQTETGRAYEPPSRRQNFAERARNADKPRDPMPRLEPDARTVRQVHAAVRNGRMGPPPIRRAPMRTAAARPGVAGTAKPPIAQAIVAPVSNPRQERDLKAATAAFERMQMAAGNAPDLDQSLKTGHSRS